MHTIAILLILLVAALHLWFLALEMFLWQKPVGLKTFHNTPEKAAATAVLAGNQGLYNGFLVAGLVWAILSGEELLPRATFFLCCVVVAGAYGAFSVSRRILIVQALPAAVALAVLWLSPR